MTALAAQSHADSAPRAGSGTMRVSIVTDAWEPQVNGVVRTLTETARELRAMGHVVELVTPQRFRSFPCPTYPEIRLSLATSRRLRTMLDDYAPDAVHIATEGPLGWAARGACMKKGAPFTTAYHTRFPEYVEPRFGVPLDWSYAVLRRFHGPAQRVMAPTPAICRDLEARGFANVALWSRGVDVEVFKPGPREALAGPRPIFLYVGRVAVEKNVEAFLALDLPGTKWVVGEGPALADLKRRYPLVRYAGVKPQPELAAIYSSADAFVFPSLTDTFGLVLLEAMACGLPVAAHPVAGPIDVIGDSPAGALDTDLRAACMRALTVPREAAIAHARRFTWRAAAQQFAEHLAAQRRPG